MELFFSFSKLCEIVLQSNYFERFFIMALVDTLKNNNFAYKWQDRYQLKQIFIEKNTNFFSRIPRYIDQCKKTSLRH